MELYAVLHPNAYASMSNKHFGRKFNFSLINTFFKCSTSKNLNFYIIIAIIRNSYSVTLIYDFDLREVMITFGLNL